jgi:murein hydrolase activator
MKIRALSRGRGLAAGGRAALTAGLVALALAGSHLARPLADPAPPEVKGDGKATPEVQLRGLEDTMRASEEQRRRIEAEIETIRADRARLNAALIDTTAKVQDTERQMDAANTRLTTLVGSENALRRSLESRRGVIADVLAVLQRMGRNPPPVWCARTTCRRRSGRRCCSAPSCPT